jgi:ParB-like nuclease domain
VIHRRPTTLRRAILESPVLALPVKCVRANCDRISSRCSQNSMDQLGQLCPIAVCPNARAGFTLIAGRHRLEAARGLEWESIRAEIRADVKGEDILLSEIDENLARGELTPAERAIHITKRKEIYEARHPETKSTKRGGPRRAKATQSQVATESTPAFIDDTAKKTGKHRATVDRDASRGDQPDLERIIGTSLDKGDELDALAKLMSEAPEAREALIVRAAAGEKVSAKTAAKQQRRAAREAELAAKIVALPADKFGVIYAVLNGGLSLGRARPAWIAWRTITMRRANLTRSKPATFSRSPLMTACSSCGRPHRCSLKPMR